MARATPERFANGFGRTADLMKALGCGRSYATALKRAAGASGRLFDVAAVLRWRKEHPEFRANKATDE